MEQVLTERP